MKRTLLTSLVILIVIIGGWYAFWGRPAQTRIADINKKILAENKKLQTYIEALARYQDQITEYNKLYASIESQQAMFSGKDEVIALYKTLDSLCHQPDYQLEEITPSLEEVIQFLRKWSESDSTITIPIRMKIKASYYSLAQLVKAVEKSKYFDHLSFCRLYGSPELYPLCSLDMTFIAGLGNRMEMFELE